MWIEYELLDDGRGEDDETFEIALANPVGGNLAGDAVLGVTILDGTGSNSAPNAIAGIGQTVTGGAGVTLDGSQSNDPDGDELTYAWTQTVGPAVSLTNADTATASFTAPSVSSDTLMRFELVVLDQSGLSDTAIASVTVSTGSGNSGGGGGGQTGIWTLALLSLLLVSRMDAFLRSSVRDPVRSK